MERSILPLLVDTAFLRILTRRSCLTFPNANKCWKKANSIWRKSRPQSKALKKIFDILAQNRKKLRLTLTSMTAFWDSALPKTLITIHLFYELSTSWKALRTSRNSLWSWETDNICDFTSFLWSNLFYQFTRESMNNHSSLSLSLRRSIESGTSLFTLTLTNRKSSLWEIKASSQSSRLPCNLSMHRFYLREGSLWIWSLVVFRLLYGRRRILSCLWIWWSCFSMCLSKVSC